MFAFSGAAAMLVAVLLARTGMLRPGLWLALALIGQAAALQLVRAGPRVGYQHYVPWGSLLDGRNALFTGLLVVQAVLVALGTRRYARHLVSIAHTWRPWQLLLVFLFFALSSATLSREPFVYAGELVLATLIQLLSVFSVVLVAASVPATVAGRIDGVIKRFLASADGTPRLDRFAVFAALFVAIVAATLSYFSYERHPHVPDEVIYLLHARYFAKGLLYLPAPPVPAAFDIDLMYYEPHRWFSPVPPGWPAALSIGSLLGVPWLVNPLLGAINVLLAYRLVWEIYDRRTARITTLLLAVSPWHVFMSMNFMTHTFTFCCALVAANAVAILRRTSRLRWAWLGGIGIGLVSLNRPLEGLAVAALLGFWALGVRGRHFRFAPVTCLALGSVLVGAITMPYNKLLTGVATKFPIMMYTDRYYGAGSNALGFGANRGLGWPGLDPFPGHGLIDVFVNTDLNTFALNVELLGWCAGSLLLLLLMIFSGRMRRADWHMLIAIAVIVGLHSLYWFSGGPDFGARYWYLILLPCLVLTARGAQVLAEKVAQTSVGGHTEARMAVLIASVCIIALTTFYPWRAVDKYHHYRGMRPDVRKLIKRDDFQNRVVLVRGNRHPDYASAAIYNPLDLQSSAPIFAWDRSEEVRRQVIAAYPGRKFWLLDGPTVTGDGYRIVGGPYTASDAAAAAARIP